jgi:CHAT domain-containing protein
VGSTELAERVRLIRSLIATRDPAADAPLRELDARIVAPIERAGMLNGVRTLIVVPHGALAYLPFSALRGGAEVEPPARYLAERYALLTVPSASAFSVIRGRAAQAVTGPAAVFAPLPAALPSTREEARAVAQELVGARLANGVQATEPAVRAALLRAPIVHIASHGTFDAESPMFSSVQLAAPTGREGAASTDDGRLETHEVLGLTVRSRLVFLSGCETALGGSASTSYSRRDDYATLAQAFLFAGAQNVVATLWRIDDRAAALFATRFYTDLASSSPIEALANAQRSLMRDSRYAAPYYWAAYTLSGSGRLD